jgi:RimJ/RimL family protein N-acetyltransferase
MTTPINILINTPNYVLRTLEENDEMSNWCDWMADPDTARMLNAPAGKLTPEDFRKYVRAFDRINHHALGVYRRNDNRLVGLWSVYVDWAASDFLINVIVGDIPERKTDIRHETARQINRYFFEELGLKFQRANTLSTNIPAIRALEAKNWTLSARGKAPSRDGNGHVEILHFTRSRDIWRSQVIAPESQQGAAANSP